MGKLRFSLGDPNSTIYFRFHNDKSIELAGWYVYNRLLAASSLKAMDHMVNNIWGSFEIQDLGDPDHLLGIRISRDRNLGTIHISQPSFINTIARRFNISAGRPILSPMDHLSSLNGAINTNETTNIPYTSLIGSINFCAILT